ncbi:MAG: N-acetyltransferase [Planctomycetaceae bacterium]|nr:N-acetyltransferase [Planctomycetaceae bacterium]
MEIVHDRDNHKFDAIAPDGSIIGEIAYAVENGDMLATHTRVSQPYRGQGLAEELLTNLVNYADEEGMKIVPLCSCVIAAFERQPAKYGHVVKAERAEM